jgi:hypothetical protein
LDESSKEMQFGHSFCCVENGLLVKQIAPIWKGLIVVLEKDGGDQLD